MDQDRLGKQASRHSQQATLEDWARPLWDGTMAVGLCNRGPKAAVVTANWFHLGLSRPPPVRDLWQ